MKFAYYMHALRSKKIVIGIISVGVVGLGGWIFLSQMSNWDAFDKRGKGIQPAPVEVASISRGPIALRRTFNGTLEARAEFVVSPKVSGRVERLTVNLADIVGRDQVVVELDNDEYVQAVAQAKADLDVARANLAEAEIAFQIAAREFERVKKLKQRGIASESRLDTAMAENSAKQAGLEVAKAQVTRAAASLETANIRLGYTKVTAGWTGGDDHRIVAERYVDEGETVSANTPLLLIVELDPITGVIFVTEQDYARLQPGLSATLTTSAYPDEIFQGRIERISPVFRENTRQARVELSIDNPRFRLKPGMFMRTSVVLDSLTEVMIVPAQAIIRRGDITGIFIVNEDSMTVSWRPVKVGIQEDGRVQIEGPGVIGGRVVSLGQQLIEDGSPITIPAGEKKIEPAGKKGDNKSNKKAGDR